MKFYVSENQHVKKNKLRNMTYLLKSSEKSIFRKKTTMIEVPLGQAQIININLKFLQSYSESIIDFFFYKRIKATE